jgi:RNA polymerase sigma-70 factor (ECF subfamily)
VEEGVIEKNGVAVERATRADRVLALVKRCQARDQRAFRLLFDETVDGVHRHLSLLLGPVPDIDDLVQLVFLNVFDAIKRFEGKSSFTTWLFRITINVANQEIRQRGRRRRLDSALSEAHRITVNASVNTPEKQIQVQREVYDILDELPLKKRETYILYMYEGYSLEEIADLLDSSVSTIGSRLQSARKEIVKILSRRRKRR